MMNAMITSRRFSSIVTNLMSLAAVLLLSILFANHAQAHHSKKYQHTANAKVVKKMHGKASYYAHRFHGRTTANGERFNMHAMTAAHKKLKFGTRVRVTNKANGKSIVVRINDRGPYIKGRHIDLSYGAAKKIGMMKSGTANVKMEILKSS